MTALSRARRLALLVPAALLIGAYGFQYIGHLAPCELCWWQRYPLFAAVPLALVAILFGRARGLSRGFTVLAALAILVSGVIGAYHAGVEYHWWKGPTHCTGGHFTSLQDLMAAPVVLCDVPQWTFHGISLAGFNAIISTLSALWILSLAGRKRRR